MPYKHFSLVTKHHIVFFFFLITFEISLFFVCVSHIIHFPLPNLVYNTIFFPFYIYSFDFKIYAAIIIKHINCMKYNVVYDNGVLYNVLLTKHFSLSLYHCDCNSNLTVLVHRTELYGDNGTEYYYYK